MYGTCALNKDKNTQYIKTAESFLRNEKVFLNDRDINPRVSPCTRVDKHLTFHKTKMHNCK